eukprot:954939-Rhodomonas_salina.1
MEKGRAGVRGCAFCGGLLCLFVSVTLVVCGGCGRIVIIIIIIIIIIISSSSSSMGTCRVVLVLHLLSPSSLPRRLPLASLPPAAPGRILRGFRARVGAVSAGADAAAGAAGGDVAARSGPRRRHRAPRARR